MGLTARARIGCELGNTDAYVSIVRAVARRKQRMGEIAGFTGLPQSTCSEYVSRLVRLGVLDRCHPMCGAPERSRYRISDGLIDLWYTVFDGLDEYDMPDDPDGRYGMVSGKLESFMDRRFGRFCAEYMESSYACNELGTWWGIEEIDDGIVVPVDIDIVADITEGGKHSRMFCDCRFGPGPMEASALEVLEDRAHRLDENGNLVLFSAVGFDDELADLAALNGAVLIGMDELMGRKEPPRLLAPTR